MSARLSSLIGADFAGLLGNCASMQRLLRRGDRMMADDKTKRGGADRRQIAGAESYEVGYFARKHDISREQAGDLIKRIGPARETLNAAASKLK
jgi:hypothetical protein